MVNIFTSFKDYLAGLITSKTLAALGTAVTARVTVAVVTLLTETAQEGGSLFPASLG